MTPGDFTVKKCKIGKGNMYLTENRLGRNEIWCREDKIFIFMKLPQFFFIFASCEPLKSASIFCSKSHHRRLSKESVSFCFPLLLYHCIFGIPTNILTARCEVRLLKTVCQYTTSLCSKREIYMTSRYQLNRCSLVPS